MGLFEKIFKYANAQAAAGQTFRMLNGYEPAFTSWNGRLYESGLVRSAIRAKANHISKLQVHFTGTAQPKLRNRLALAPNDWQTWGQLLSRTSTILDIHNTAFIVPTLDEAGDADGIFTVLPTLCELREFGGVLYLRYQFATGQIAAVEFSRCGILNNCLYSNDLFGESNEALTPTMELINIQNQGITEAVQSSATYRFMARLTNFSDPKDLAKERKRFTKENLRSGGGVLLWPNTYDNIQQIKPSPYVVDAEQMKLIENNVHGYFGTNEGILQNKASGDDLNAFYDGAVEPFAIQFSEVVSGMLYSRKERSMGSGVTASSNRLQFLSNKEKLELTVAFADRGLAMRDDLRAIWSLPPLPDGLGQTIPMRGEYYNLGEKKPEKKPEKKQEGLLDADE